MDLIDLLDDLEINRIARVCHEANRALQQNAGEVVNFPWDNTSQSMRDSTTEGVRGILTGKTPAESHEGWCENRLAAGWVYGLTKDFTALTHPCLVSYEDLPADQKAKDGLFSAIVLTLARYA